MGYNASNTWYNGRRYTRYQYCDSCQKYGTPKYCANQAEEDKCMTDLWKEAQNPAFNYTACGYDPKWAVASKKCESDASSKIDACLKAYEPYTYPNNPCMTSQEVKVESSDASRPVAAAVAALVAALV